MKQIQPAPQPLPRLLTLSAIAMECRITRRRAEAIKRKGVILPIALASNGSELFPESDLPKVMAALVNEEPENN